MSESKSILEVMDFVQSAAGQILINVASNYVYDWLKSGRLRLPGKGTLTVTEPALQGSVDIAFAYFLHSATDGAYGKLDRRSERYTTALVEFLSFETVLNELVEIAATGQSPNLEYFRSKYDQSPAVYEAKPEALQFDRSLLAWNEALTVTLSAKAANGGGISQYFQAKNLIYVRELLVQLSAQMSDMFAHMDEERTARIMRTPAFRVDITRSLPKQFVKREDVNIEVEAKLGDENKVVALVGIPGTGKSSLAIDYGHSDAARSQFPQGVYWIDIGKRPDAASITSGMRNIIAKLGGATDFSDPRNGAIRLRDALHSWRCLIVLDDVWDASVARTLVEALGQSGSCIMMTTRSPAVAADLGAEILDVEKMSLQAALELLAKWANCPVSALPNDAKLVAHECGYLPLALSLCGATNADGSDWATILSALKEGDWTELDHELADYDYRDLLRAIRASFEHLADKLKSKYGDASDLASFALDCALSIGIFAEDSLIPKATVQQFWLGRRSGRVGFEDLAADKLWIEMARLNLIQAQEVDGATFCSIHDVIVDYMRAAIRKDLVQVHGQLLHAWNPDPKPWHSILDDRYRYDHLIYHLIAAKRPEDVIGLFLTDDWMIVRHQNSGYVYDGFRSDLLNVLDLDELQWSMANGRQAFDAAFASTLRLILILSSIQSLAANYPVNLLLRAVATGHRKLEQVWSIANLHPNAVERSRLLTGLLSTRTQGIRYRSSSTLAEEALTAAMAIGDEFDRARTLSDLADKLEGEQRAAVLERALAAAMAIGDKSAHALALSNLGRKLEREQRAAVLERALTAALAIGDESAHAWALSGLTDRLEGEQVERALTAALAIGGENSRAMVLSLLADKLEGEQVERALTAALAIGNESSRAWALSRLADKLEGEQRAAVLECALTAAMAIGDEFDRAGALSGLADRLEGEQRAAVLECALTAAMAIGDEFDRARVLSGLADKLEGEQRAAVLERALTAAMAIGDESSRARALSGLADKLEGEQRAAVLECALTAAMAIGGEYRRAEALSGLADKLEGEQRAAVLERALTAALAIGDEYYRAGALSGLADKLEEEQVERALTAALAIGGESSRARALSGLADKLEGEQVERALTAQLAIGDEYYRAPALSRLADRLEGEQRAAVLERALTAAMAIGDEHYRAEALSDLADKLEGEQVARALTAAMAIGDEHYRARALSGLADKLEGEQVERALTAAMAIGDEYYRAPALSGLADRLEGEQLERALTAAMAIGDEYYRAEALSGLADRLEGEQLERALTAALAIGDEYYRARALSRLADRLEGEQRAAVLECALTAAMAIGDEFDRARVLSGLADKLEGEQRAAVLERALTAAMAIGGESSRARVLSGLADKLEGEQRAAVLERALTAAMAIGDEYHRAWALSGLADKLEGEQRAAVLERALTAAMAIGGEPTRAEVLSDLADRLEGEQVERALTAAMAIGDEFDRARVLSGLTDRLEGEQVERALTAALAIGDEHYRAAALSGLADRLEGEQRAALLERALTAATASGDGFNSSALDVLLLDRTPGERRLRNWRAYLVRFSNRQSRSELLRFIPGWIEMYGVSSTEPTLDPLTIVSIAESIEEVCTKWRWQ